MMHKRVADVMTRDVVCVRTDTPFDEVVRVLAEHRISGAPVVDDTGRVVGMVTEADLLGRQARAGGAAGTAIWHLLRRRAFARKGVALTAAELMTAPAVTLAPGDRLTTAAATLARHDIKRAVVVDADRIPTGIVSRKDLLAVYLRPDAELADEIRTNVLDRALCVPTGEVSVDVVQGVATLRGKVERRSMIDIANVLTAAVDGVVDVHTHLTADLDDTRIPPPQPADVGILFPYTHR
ncbi:CBS domain-containing protein [Nocardia mexicana]|uniref:CBS domain protein n=1 Tax=Nocardia mexicana TaxID=279262 RepID=A0A370GJC5_9NOCA|nr:CBS domain-containing protein [Nocardia mexicana]RDI43329.1 CBS domain protein [Nocardia mexicana]